MSGSSVANSKLDNASTTGSNVSGSSVTGGSVASSNVTGSNATNASLTNNTLVNSSVNGGSVTGGSVASSNVTSANVANTSVSNSALNNATTANASLSNTSVNGGSVSGSNASNVVVTDATFSTSNATNANFTNSAVNGSNVANASFANSNATDTNMTNSVFANGVITGGLASNSNITNATGINASFNAALINASNLQGGNIANSVLNGNSNVTGAAYSNATFNGGAITNATGSAAVFADALINGGWHINSSIANSTIDKEATIVYANISNANISNSFIYGSAMSNATLNNATGYGSNITNAVINGGKFDGYLPYNETRQEPFFNDLGILEFINITTQKLNKSQGIFDNVTLSGAATDHIDIKNSVVANSSIANGSLINSKLDNSTSTLVVFSNNTVNNSNIIGGYINGHSQISNSNLTGFSAQDPSKFLYLNESTVKDSNITGAGVIITDSTIINSTVVGRTNATNIKDNANGNNFQLLGNTTLIGGQYGHVGLDVRGTVNVNGSQFIAATFDAYGVKSESVKQALAAAGVSSVKESNGVSSKFNAQNALLKDSIFSATNANLQNSVILNTTFAGDGLVFSGGSVINSTVVGEGNILAGAVTNHGSATLQNAGATIGGFNNKVNQTGNITISGSSVTGLIAGKFVNVSGNANGGSALIGDANINGTVVGGLVNGSGDASANQVFVGGNSTISGDLVGGLVDGGAIGSTANDNTVTIANNVVVGGNIVGGLVLSANGEEVAANFAGNTLNVKSARVTANDIKNFNLIKFEVPTNSNGALINLTGNGTTSLKGTTVAVSGSANEVTNAANPVTITLIQKANGEIVADSSTGVVGNFGGLDVDVQKADGNRQLIAVLRSGLAENQVSLYEGALASVVGLNEGAVNVASMLNTLSADTAAAGSDFVIASAQGGKYESDTGGKITSNVFTADVGVGRNVNDRLFYGAFLDYGTSSYETENDYALNRVEGSGDASHIGLGLFAKGLFGDAYQSALTLSARAGIASNTYSATRITNTNSKTIIDNAELNRMYYGVSAELSHKFMSWKDGAFEIYGGGSYTKVAGDSVAVGGHTYEVDSINSLIGRVGLKLTEEINDKWSAYADVAFEREFLGDVDGKHTNGGYKLSDNYNKPSLQGNSVVGEVGATYTANAKGGFTVNVKLKGASGQKKGVGGGFDLKYKF